MSITNWNVLVVEDEADSMELVQELLAYSGIKSVAATSGEAALQSLREMTPTLIILDLALPGIDGWGILKAVRTNKALAHVPCVAITAFHTPELAEQAIAAGFNAYFAKPLDASSFVRELQAIANGSSAI
jgi:two-component system cell cycle response regulator DivK